MSWETPTWLGNLFTIIERQFLKSFFWFWCFCFVAIYLHIFVFLTILHWNYKDMLKHQKQMQKTTHHIIKQIKFFSVQIVIPTHWTITWFVCCLWLIFFFKKGKMMMSSLNPIPLVLYPISININLLLICKHVKRRTMFSCYLYPFDIFSWKMSEQGVLCGQIHRTPTKHIKLHKRSWCAFAY